ncbi:DUF3887 domain-containing protein [Actinocrispum wychmicini]|uniref:DUF3887 domain-containing protein n=1 Tax=Actinocrispum wychmicini TaxID=1213861 RepID=A0A4R2JQX4_9PSEU|nr:DUF3887 domain-containing protein [Actinocrispum wychmicini]TCO59598.1 hypothetical protein EV192_104441 [Actinocrispum wychmicini]
MNDELAELAATIEADAARLGEAARAGAMVSTELAAVRMARELSALTETAMRISVRRARAAGHTWQEIGDVLGVSRQAAFQRFGQPVDPRTGQEMSRDLLPGAADRAVVILGDFLSGRADAVVAEFAPETLAKPEADPDAIASASAQVAGLVGAFERMGEPVVSPLGDYTLVNVPLSFEAGEMKGRVSFTADGKVSGLWVLHPDAP